MKVFLKTGALALLAAFVCFMPLVLDGALSQRAKEKNQTTVLVMWHLDTFEGGTGSRQDFLMKSAADFNKAHEDVFISVIKHTEESVEAAFEKGVTPDLISFGTGVGGVLDRAKPLKTHKNSCFFNSASFGGETYFYPYAYGKYVLFCAESKKKGTVAGRGERTHPLFAALFGGEGADEVMAPAEAYSAFAAGKFDKLIGTQRDVYRLTRRGMQFTCSALSDFTDLVQYVAVLSADPARSALAEDFCEYLISDEVQKRLPEIGLFSPVGADVDYGVAEMNALAREQTARVLSALLDPPKRDELLGADGQNDFLEKFENSLAH